MSIYAYNTKQQALNARKLSSLLGFISNDFGGIISDVEDPIKFTSNGWYWNSALEPLASFVGGGIQLDYDVPHSPTGSGAADVYPKVFNLNTEVAHMWGLDVTLENADATILDNKYSNESDPNRAAAKIVEVNCKSVESSNVYFVITDPSGNPSQKGYYEYSSGAYRLSSDSSVVSGKTYYYKLANEAFHIEEANFTNIQQKLSFDYYGNTIWITNNRFFIPFCCIKVGGTTKLSMVFSRDKNGYESFLSVRTYNNLLAQLNDLYVHRSGGEKVGDIGQLNITGYKITNKNNGKVEIKNPYFDLGDVGNGNISTLLTYDFSSHKVNYKSNYKIPVGLGGTGADNKLDAKTNLGIYYNTGEPDSTKVAKPKEGDIYFKIL